MRKKAAILLACMVVFCFKNLSYCANADTVPSYSNDGSWVVISHDSSNPNEIITDDSTINTSGKSINDIISDLIHNNKKRIYIKDGEYDLTNQLTIDVPDVVIIGQSKENTKLVRTGDGISIKITESNVQISSLNIDGSNTENIVLHAQNVDDITIENCIIEGSKTQPSIAFYDTDATTYHKNNTVSGNSISSQLYAKDIIYFYQESNSKITDNIVQGGSISFYSCDNLTVDHNKVDGSLSNGIKGTVGVMKSFAPASEQKLCSDYAITNNVVNNTEDSGIAIIREINSDTNRYENMFIEGNTVSNSKYFGLEIGDLKGAQILENQISNIYYEGIYLLFSDDTIIENNTISDAGIAGSDYPWNRNLSSGIFLDTGVQNSNIENNRISNSSLCSFGVKVLSNSNPINFNNYITNNIITGNFTEGISANEASPEYTHITTEKPNLTATVTEDSIIINWNEIIGVEEYEVVVDNDYANLVSIENAMQYIHTGLSAYSTHTYRVRMKYGQWSDPITATTSATPEIISTSSTENSIKVIWDSISADCEYDLKVDGTIIDVGTNTSYTHEDLESGSTHYYQVRIKSKNGILVNGPWSDSVEVSTITSAPITTPPVVTTPPAVGPQQPGGNPDNSKANSHGHKEQHRMAFEISFEDSKTLYYQENLVNDNEENKLKKMILYTFGGSYYFNFTTFKDSQITSNNTFKIDLLPKSIFSEKEIEEIANNKEDSKGTIVVRDFSNTNDQEKKDYNQYSIIKDYTCYIGNAGIELKGDERHTRNGENDY